jgi:hypothetical protein
LRLGLVHGFSDAAALSPKCRPNSRQDSLYISGILLR